MSQNLENKGEKRPRLSDGETPKPEGKLYKMSSDDDDIKTQFKTIIESMNDIKKGQSSMQKMFESKLDKMKTELMSSIDDKVKVLKSDIDLQWGQQQTKIEQLSNSVESVMNRLTVVEGVVAEGSISGATNVNQTNQSYQNNQVNPLNNDEVTVIASGVPFEEGEDILIKAKQIVAEINTEISENDIVAAFRLKSRRQDRPGFVKIIATNVDTKRRILREKHKLRNSTNFKNIYLRSSKSHVERMFEINTRTLLKELPHGSSYRLTANGRIIKKTTEPANENEQTDGNK